MFFATRRHLRTTDVNNLNSPAGRTARLGNRLTLPSEGVACFYDTDNLAKLRLSDITRAQLIVHHAKMSHIPTTAMRKIGEQ